jgi:hypothetical protein
VEARADGPAVGAPRHRLTAGVRHLAMVGAPDGPGNPPGGA